MRLCSVLVLFAVDAGCGASLAQPAMIPNLTAMPEDGQTRDAIIDSSFAQPSPEQQPTTKRGRHIETAAATWAAIVGMWLSKTDNVEMGVRFEENDVVQHPKPHPSDDARDGGAVHAASHDNGSAPIPVPAPTLLPWIPLEN